MHKVHERSEDTFNEGFNSRIQGNYSITLIKNCIEELFAQNKTSDLQVPYLLVPWSAWAEIYGV